MDKIYDFLKFFWDIFSFRKNSNFILSARSSQWHNVRNNFIKNNPSCAVCGKKENLIVHHIIPVHIDASKELDESNLITMCQSKTINCHFIFAHFLNWSKYNPNIVEDSKIWNQKLTN